jgi:hypothetical protein
MTSVSFDKNLYTNDVITNNHQVKAKLDFDSDIIPLKNVQKVKIYWFPNDNFSFIGLESLLLLFDI